MVIDVRSSGRLRLIRFQYFQNETMTLIAFYLQILAFLLGILVACYGVICIYELLFGKSVSEEWIARAEGIRKRHPETGAILYFLERGDIGYLAEWIRSFEASNYESVKDKFPGLLRESERINGLILAMEEGLQKAATELRFQPPSTEGLLKARNMAR